MTAARTSDAEIAALVRRSREAQGLPPQVTDPEALRRIARLCRSTATNNRAKQ